MENSEDFVVIQRMYNIPTYITVYDTEEILGVSVQLVRKQCEEGKIEAVQPMPNSGNWRIETSQFVNYPGWSKFLEKKAVIKEKSLRLAEYMAKNLDELNN